MVMVGEDMEKKVRRSFQAHFENWLRPSRWHHRWESEFWRFYAQREKELERLSKAYEAGSYQFEGSRTFERGGANVGVF